MLKLAFSGRLRAGKDYVASKTGASIVGFADPIYDICKYYFGSADKSLPGMRAAMQAIGQYGWGCVNDKYPLTLERATWVTQLRIDGYNIFSRSKLFKHVNWNEYGRRKDFWVNIMLTRPDMLDETYEKDGVAIVNARFDHEFEPLQKAGFQRFHVMCSEETRRKRIEHFDPVADQDPSEHLAMRLDKEAPDSTVVWNDALPMPEGKGYMTVESFVKSLALN